MRSSLQAIFFGLPFAVASVWLISVLTKDEGAGHGIVSPASFDGELDSYHNARDPSLRSDGYDSDLAPSGVVLPAERSLHDSSRCAAGSRLSSKVVDGYMPQTELKATDYEDGGTLLLHSWFEGDSPIPGLEYLFSGYLVTQNLDRTKLVMWLTDDWEHAESPVKRYLVEKYRFHPNIEFRMFDKPALVQGTCWEDRPEFMEKKTILTYGIRDYSNVVRWLLLHKYGGIWLDADSIPLMDMTWIHEKHPTEIVVGYSEPTVIEKQQKRDRLKELGMFNNNFIHLTDLEMRAKIIELGCEFRRKPLEDGDSGYGNEPFVNVIPKVGKDQHEMYVMNHWLFNDGTLRYCWIRDDCRLARLDLGSVDPIWVRSNDMYAICERVIQSHERYTGDFNELLKSRNTEGGLRGYMDSLDENSHVFVVHDRLGHCRTGRTVPIGMSKWFGDLMALHMPDGNPLKVPAAPANVMAWDPFEVTKEKHELEFLPLIIIVESPADRFADRQFIRGILNHNTWFPDLFESMSRLVRVFFAVPYHHRYNDWNAKLQGELFRHRDLLLLDPHDESMPRSKTSLVSPVMRRAVLKVLRTHESRFMMFMFGSPASTFVHVRNLFYLLNVASGMALFNKERSPESFVITHPLDDDLEVEVQETMGRYTTGNDKTGRPYTRTIFRRFEGLKKSNEVVKSNAQSFVLFTRDNLHKLIGITQDDLPESAAEAASLEDSVEIGGQPNFRYEYAADPMTYYDAMHRHPPYEPRDNLEILHKPVHGLAALTPEAFRFFSSPVGGESMRAFREKYVRDDCNVLKQNLESSAYPMPSRLGRNMRDAIVHTNITFVWDVPCRSIFWDLNSAIETIPMLFIK